MPQITQHLFNRKRLGSVLNAASADSLADHATLSDVKRRIMNWRSLTDQKILEGKNEISLQDSFLSDIFGRILDYKSIHESPEEWHLYREKKTVTDATRSDAALGFFTSEGEDVRAVIELKDAKTNLDAKQKRKGANYTPVEQAFLYSGKFGRKCKWVIVSNYKEMRLYNRNASMNEYESFTIKALNDEAELKRFLYLLSRKNLIEKESDSITDVLYNSDEAEQEKITREFYNRYKGLRIHLYEHLREKNPGYDELVLLEKTQKILDRFIFVCFCEDFGLVPERIFRKMTEAVKNPAMFVNVTPWDQMKNLFRAIDQGSPRHNINRFNGGLFEYDEILDGKLVMADDVFDELAEISDYDFGSDLNVNVLGHIFEQSITDIEEIRASVAGRSYDKKKGKRKKEGIYYTPEHITRHIVEQAVGGWLEERKTELGYDRLPELTEKDFRSVKYYKKTGGIRSSNRNIKDHLDFWQAYKERLSDIRVLDPACGSGAFLNQAFDYLYKEGQYVNDRIAKLRKGQTEVFRLDEHILRNNLHGADLNPESVEITKLGLWLKTADKHSELTSLDENVRCGNSLIDDPRVAGKRAFKWKEEFPEIMRNGGFDVVIGNPPYVFAREKISEQEKKFYISNYCSSQYQVNTYVLFIEKTVGLLRKTGYLGLIVPNAWLMVSSATKLREFLLKSLYISSVVNLSGYSFEGVNVETIIINAKKEKTQNSDLKVFLSKENRFEYSHSINQADFKRNKGFEFRVFSDERGRQLTEKIKADAESLDNLAIIKAGLKAYEAGKGKPEQTRKDVRNRPYDYNYQWDDMTFKYLEGKNVGRYFVKWTGSYLRYGKHLAAPRTFDIFSNPNIIIREITGNFPKSIIATYNQEIYLFNMSNIAILEKENMATDLKYILAVINSTLLSYYFLLNTAKSVRKMFPKIILRDLRQFPIKRIHPEDQQPFIAKADLMLSENKKFQDLRNDLLEFVKSELKPQKITKKLENWPESDWDQFKKELAKGKVKIENLSLRERKEWHDYFRAMMGQATEIRSVIEATDRETDQMVYELYGLTEEEIKIVENAA